jgi:hypothetical protein
MRGSSNDEKGRLVQIFDASKRVRYGVLSEVLENLDLRQLCLVEVVLPQDAAYISY